MTAERGGRIDLHTHSSCSDGRLAPEELVEEAVWRGLNAIALTDHDSVDGNDRAVAAGRARGVEVVPGVELSCEIDGRETHLVGLFVEPTAGLLERLAAMRRLREARMREMLDRLAGLGIAMTMDDLPRDEGQAYGRPHLAQALVARGVVESVNEAFARYLGDRGPVNVPKQRFPVDEGLALLREARAVSVLAHPEKSGLLAAVPDLAARGLQAVEAYLPSSDPAVERQLEALARAHGLALSGGSDFHDPREGAGLGVPSLGMELLDTLRARKDSLWPSVS